MHLHDSDLVSSTSRTTQQRFCPFYFARYRCTCTIRASLQAHRGQISREFVPSILYAIIALARFRLRFKHTEDRSAEGLSPLSRTLLNAALAQFILSLKHIEDKSERTLSPLSHTLSNAALAQIKLRFKHIEDNLARVLFSIPRTLSMLSHSSTFASERNYRAFQLLCTKLSYSLRHLQLHLHFKRLDKRQTRVFTRLSRALPASRGKTSKSSHSYVPCTIFLCICPFVKLSFSR